MLAGYIANRLPDDAEKHLRRIVTATVRNRPATVGPLDAKVLQYRRSGYNLLLLLAN
jgi:hypothetical protein